MKYKLRNKRAIAICYLLNAIHCFIGYIAMLCGVTSGDKSIVFLGILLAIMVPLTVFDDRPQMTGTVAVWLAIVLHSFLDIWIILLSACYWLACISAMETTLIIIFWKKSLNK